MRFAPAPALSLQHTQVGAEDVVEAAGQETPLLILVQHRETRPGAAAAVMGTEHAAAQAVDGADAHPGEVSRAPGGGGQGDETLLQFPRRGPGIGAQHQVLRLGQAPEQDVGSPQRHRQGLAGAGTRDAQRGALEMADQLQLPLVQARVQPQYGGRHARRVVHVHVGSHLSWSIDWLGMWYPVGRMAAGVPGLTGRGKIIVTSGVNRPAFGASRGR